MMKQTLLACMLLTLGPSLLADEDPGKIKHDKYCQKCHDSSVYTRPDRFIKDRAALQKQVARCGLNSDTQWFDEDVEAVTRYLDQTFYKFQ